MKINTLKLCERMANEIQSPIHDTAAFVRVNPVLPPNLMHSFVLVFLFSLTPTEYSHANNTISVFCLFLLLLRSQSFAIISRYTSTMSLKHNTNCVSSLFWQTNVSSNSLRRCRICMRVCVCVSSNELLQFFFL